MDYHHRREKFQDPNAFLVSIQIPNNVENSVRSPTPAADRARISRAIGAIEG